MRPIMALVLIIASVSLASEVKRAQSTKAKTQKTQISFPKGPPVDCGAITDGLCNKLWDPENRGDLKVFDGTLKAGNSKVSRFPKAYIADMQALIESEPRLPADLRVKLQPILAEIKKTWADEKRTDQWYRKIADLETQLDRAIQDVGRARVEAQKPDLRNFYFNDLKWDDQSFVAQEFKKIDDEILDAKYANHPNWKLVEETFSEVKSDMLDAVSSLKIPDEQKKLILDQLRSVLPSLPYNDPHKMPQEKGCDKSLANAFYATEYNRFTVCAGLFNKYQSKSALYFVIAHELSHSIDPDRLAQLNRKSSKVSQALAPLANSSTPPFSCDDWAQVVKDATTHAKNQPPPKMDMQKLYDCLAPKDELEVVDAEKFETIVRNVAKRQMSYIANSNEFVMLTEPKNRDEAYKIRDNPYYRRPDRVDAYYNGHVITKRDRQPNGYEIYNQSLECASISENGKTYRFSPDDKKHRSKVMDKALEETKLVHEIMVRDEYANCGSNCSGLAGDYIAKGSNEEFADWLASQAESRYLSRISATNRREASALGPALFCAEPGIMSEAEDLAAVEKKYASASHPDDRNRRIGLYNRQNATLVNCNFKDEEKGTFRCEF